DGIRDRNVTGVQTCALPICDKPMLNRNIVTKVSASENSFQLFSCTVTSGTKPISFAWSFNQKTLSSGGNVKIENNDNFSLLTWQIGRASCRERVKMTGGDGT